MAKKGRKKKAFAPRNEIHRRLCEFLTVDNLEKLSKITEMPSGNLRRMIEGHTDIGVSRFVELLRAAGLEGEAGYILTGKESQEGDGFRISEERAAAFTDTMNKLKDLWNLTEELRSDVERLEELDEDLADSIKVALSHDLRGDEAS